MKENIIGKEGAIFKLNFLSLVDKTIESILPIQYEFPLEKITTNLKEEEEYQQFIYNIFIPRLKEFINENISFYKIIAIELKIKNDKILNNKIDENNKNNDPEYLYKDQSAKIKLNEKSFQQVRDDILNMLLIDFINNSVENNYWILDDEENDDNNNLLCLKNFISYKKINIHNKIEDYEYKIYFKFKDYIKIIINKDLYIQFKFWFLFLLQKIRINISSIEYEYYINNNENKNKNININNNPKKIIDFNQIIKNRIILFLNDYGQFIDGLLNDKSSFSIFKAVPRNRRPKITLIVINNINWIDYLLYKLEKEKKNIKQLIINYNQEKNNNKNDIIEINTNSNNNENLIENNRIFYYNNIYIKLFGKYSIYQLNSILDKQNINSVDNIIINIDNFHNFEYISLMQEEEEIINVIKKNAIKILSSLNKYLIRIKKNKLKSIIFYIKYFNNNNILLTEIQEKFNEFMIELIKQSVYVKYINIFFSNIINENDYNDEYVKPDLIYSLPYLDEYEYKNIHSLKINQEKKFKLVLFDNNIRIKNSQTIDFYFFEYFSLQRITHLIIGYFHNIKELNKLLTKIKLYELCNMRKFVCFLKSNNKINEKTLTTFFKLEWPKNALESIKIIFEKFVKIKDDNIILYPRYNKNVVLLDMNKIFNIIKELYYNTISKDEIKKIILEKYQDDLGGTMIIDKKNNETFEKQINIIKKKKYNNIKNDIEENNTSNNNTNITNNKNTTNISIMQHSKNILLQTSQPTINEILENNNKNYFMNDLRSVNDTINNNNYLFKNDNINNRVYYPLKKFLIINSETYLKYFININTKDFLKKCYIYNSIIEKNNNKKKNKIEDKYNLIENCKKSLLVLNKNKNNILSLLIALKKTQNSTYSKLLNSRLKYKIIHYEYYKRNSTIFDYILTFMNTPILIYNDFRYSKKLFKNVVNE